MKANEFKNLKKNTVYNVGFTNADGEEDETQFDLYENPEKELERLWEDFCEENECDSDSISYVEEAEDELTGRQQDRIDDVYQATYDFCVALTENNDLPWDMAYLGEIADVAAEILARNGHRVHFPSIVDEEDGSSSHVEEYIEPEGVEKKGENS